MARLLEQIGNLVESIDLLQKCFAALQKYRQAARLFKQRPEQKRYQETPKIIQALEHL